MILDLMMKKEAKFGNWFCYALAGKNLPVKKSKTYFCIAYERDFEEAYAFYCARYENISLQEFLHLGLTEFNMKLAVYLNQNLYIQY